MGRFILLTIVAALLFFGEHCEADFHKPAHPNLLYARALNACEDKLAEWKQASTKAGAASKSLPSVDGRNYTDMTFLMGKWKKGSGGIRPSFLSADSGRVDLYSSELAGLVHNNDPNSPTPIQNITGQMYFVKRRDAGSRFSIGAAFDIGGFSDGQSGEVCLVSCMRKLRRPSLAPASPEEPTNNRTTRRGRVPIPEYSDGDCGMRVLFTVSHQDKAGRKTATGTFESLRNASDNTYFTKFSLTGKMVDPREQRFLYRWDRIMKSLIFAVEAVVIVWQTVHSIRSPSSYFVSMFMIMVQIAAMCFLSVYLISVPWRLMTMKVFKYLFTNYVLVPWLTLTVVILLNVVFLLVILRKRRVAKRLNVVERPQEVLLAVVCLMIYAVTGLVLWSAHNFEAYVQVVWCWFLLPQVAANVVWDLRLKPLHWAYVVGVSVCRVVYIAFNAARPRIYGLDDIEDFPHGWFWGITGTVVVFASYALLQQYYGGRCFLPQRWFGYQHLASSKAQASQEETDTMLDL